MESIQNNQLNLTIEATDFIGKKNRLNEYVTKRMKAPDFWSSA